MDTRTLRLKTAFEKSGLTQAEVCEKTGINKGAFSSYLSGRYFPKQKALEKLSIVLKVSIPYLMGLEDLSSDTSLSVLESQLVANYRQLNEEGQDKMLEYSEDLVASGRYIKSDEDGLVEEAE